MENMWKETVVTYVRFEIFKAVIMKNAIFWDVTLCGSCKKRHFAGMYHLHDQGEKNQRARNNVSSICEAFFSC
jgi:hypothetical protein